MMNMPSTMNNTPMITAIKTGWVAAKNASRTIRIPKMKIAIERSLYFLSKYGIPINPYAINNIPMI